MNMTKETRSMTTREYHYYGTVLLYGTVLNGSYITLLFIKGYDGIYFTQVIVVIVN